MPTNISWTDETWNPVTGCTKVSPGCARCYAEAITLRFKRGGPFLPGKTTIRLHPDRLDQPLHWRKPRRIFVCSMSDLFHEDVSDEFIASCFEKMYKAPQHTFQVLTKRPERMKAFFDHMNPRWPFVPWPLPNVWLGVSVENQYWADQRIPLLLQTAAAVRFLSMEPLLKDVDLREWLGECTFCRGGGIVDGGMAPGGTLGFHAHLPEPCPACFGGTIDWTIVGGESGPRHRPMEIAWVRDIVDQCRAAGVPVFVKQDSGAKPGQQGRLPDDLWALKEFPSAAPG